MPTNQEQKEERRDEICTHLIDVFGSESVLSQNLIGGQVEHVQGVRTRLHSRITDAHRSSVQYP